MRVMINEHNIMQLTLLQVFVELVRNASCDSKYELCSDRRAAFKAD